MTATETPKTQTKSNRYPIEENLIIGKIEIKDPMLKAALEFYSLRDGCSIEEWIVRPLLGALEGEDPSAFRQV